jgi:hypothetical protein
MIDTSKYEGHTPANQWRVLQYCEESLGVFFLAGTTNPNKMYEEECLHCGPQRDGLSQQVFDGRMSDEEVNKLCKRDSANQTLMQDAPLLLEEVKRLRDLVGFAIAAIDSNHCYMGEEAQADLRDYLKEAIE